MSKIIKRIDAILGNPSKRKINARTFYDSLIRAKKQLKPISPDDKILQQLEPEERRFAAEAINKHVFSKLDGYIEEGKPEENEKDTYYEEDVF